MNLETVKIEKDIPLQAGHRGRYGKYDAKILSMDVGDSFAVDIPSEGKDRFNAVCRLRGVLGRLSKSSGYKFSIRTSHGIDVARAWRTA